MHFQALSRLRRTAAAVALSSLLASPAMSGPVSTLYLSSFTTARIYAIQGDTVGAGAPTYCNHCEVPIAVDGDIRTLGIAGSGGGQYRLDGTQTGVTYGPGLPAGSGVLLTDGTTDGLRNYAVSTQSGGSASAIYAFGRDWGSGRKLFDIDFRIDADGVTYDPTSQSLWIVGTYSFDNVVYGLMRNYALDGTQLSQFFAGAYGGTGLAMDYADGTLWTTRGPTQFFDQYARDGTLLQTVSYASLVGQGGRLGIEFNLAGDSRALPEPASGALVALALALGAVRRRRPRC